MASDLCQECGEPLLRRRSNSRYCSDKCRYRARDRAKYEADPEGEREKSRRYYAENRARVIARVLERERANRAGKVAGGAVWVAGLKYCACGALIANARHWHCDICRKRRRRHKQREKELRRPYRGTREERGYGKDHQLLRSKLIPFVESGLAVCARCGKPIGAKEPWDLGHDDHDRTRHTGPEHIKCNRATSGRQRRSAAA